VHGVLLSYQMRTSGHKFRICLSSPQLWDLSALGAQLEDSELQADSDPVCPCRAVTASFLGPASLKICSVNIVTELRAGRLGFDSRLGQEVFIFAAASIPTLWLSPGDKAAGS